MHKIIRYHTTLAGEEFFWQHVEIAKALETKQINTYNEYQSACEKEGIMYYSEQLFNEYIAQRK